MYCIYRITNKVNGNTYIGQHMYTNEADPMGKYKGSGLLLKKAYKSPDEKQYGMFRVCPEGWLKTNPREVNERLRRGK